MVSNESRSGAWLCRIPDGPGGMAHEKNSVMKHRDPSVNIERIIAAGIARCGSMVSCAAIGISSTPRKNQNGNENPVNCDEIDDGNDVNW